MAERRPPLRLGVLSADEVRELIAPVTVGMNPALGSLPGLPGHLGCQRWHIRRQAERRIPELGRAVAAIRASLEADGQRNPVFLCARWGLLLVSFGGTRTMWAWESRRPLAAVVADYDNRFPEWGRATLKQLAKDYADPPGDLGWTEWGGLTFVVPEVWHGA